MQRRNVSRAESKYPAHANAPATAALTLHDARRTPRACSRAVQPETSLYSFTEATVSLPSAIVPSTVTVLPAKPSIFSGFVTV